MRPAIVGPARFFDPLAPSLHVRVPHSRLSPVNRVAHLRIILLEAGDVEVGAGGARGLVGGEGPSQELTTLMESDEARNLPELGGAVLQVLQEGGRGGLRKGALQVPEDVLDPGVHPLQGPH